MALLGTVWKFRWLTSQWKILSAEFSGELEEIKAFPTLLILSGEMLTGDFTKQQIEHFLFKAESLKESLSSAGD